jgi:hypothetical protein
VVVALMRAADRVGRRASRIVEPHGITLQQYNVLHILQDSNEDGVPTLERCPRDRRQHLCWLSSEGARLLETLTPILAAGHERVLEHFDSGKRQRLVSLLDLIGSED